MQRACVVLYCHLWPVWLHHSFRHYLIKGTIFEKKKKLLNVKCEFWFSVQLLSKIFLILRIIQQDIIMNVKHRHVKCPLLLSNSNETWIFSTDFRKQLNISFHENPSSGRRAAPCGRTDGQKWRSWLSLFEILRKRLKMISLMQYIILPVGTFIKCPMMTHRAETCSREQNWLHESCVWLIY